MLDLQSAPDGLQFLPDNHRLAVSDGLSLFAWHAKAGGWRRCGWSARRRGMETVTGGCQCGRIRYEARVADDDAYLCHCRMCQKATGGVAAAFKSVLKAEVRWLGAEPEWYASSAIAARPFCSACGTPLGFAYPDSPRMDLTVGSFDDPSRLRPTSHFGAESLHEAWLDTAGLDRMRTDDHQPLVERWEKAGGEPRG